MPFARADGIRPVSSSSAVRHSPPRLSGFTLIELVVALTISSILVGFIAMFVSAPVDAYFDQAERAVLNDSAEVVSRSFTRDFRLALPNSVRTRNAGSRAIVEMLKVEAASFYRPAGTLGVPPTEAARELDFNIPGDTFAIFGRLNADAALNLGTYDVPWRLVVNNQGMGSPNRNAYQPASANNVISPAGLTVTRNVATNEESVQLPIGFRFIAPEPPPAPPPLNRLFAVSGPITYICNSAAGTLRRFSNYPISQAIPTSEASVQLNGADDETLATNVTSCSVRCEGGGANVDVCQDTLVLEVALSRVTPPRNESVWILEQVPMDNDL